MSGVELIVAALAAGAAAGVTDTASSAIRDGYAGLREALRARLTGRGDAVQVLDEGETDPEALRARLDQDLVDAGADQDEQVLAAAGRILRLLDPVRMPEGRDTMDLRGAKGVQVGDHNTQTNTFS